MQKLTYAEVLTLASFFEMMSDSEQDFPTYIWSLFDTNYEKLKTPARELETKLYDKFIELFPEGVDEVEPSIKLEKDREYQEYRVKCMKEDTEVDLTTISREKFETDVPSMKGVRGIYLFLKYVANEQA